MCFLVICVYVFYVLTSCHETSSQDLERREPNQTNPENYHHMNNNTSSHPSSSLNCDKVSSAISNLSQCFGISESEIKKLKMLPVGKYSEKDVYNMFFTLFDSDADGVSQSKSINQYLSNCASSSCPIEQEDIQQKDLSQILTKSLTEKLPKIN
ncbi:hypothetical protein EDEG_03366 [Edhazardia aedis USNM 41457]|uniref:EF-hand domain-containing protein n=1 Tax=Edhazardia aedis (strain USNM 41457) TaxID=1003232 RepID=J9DHU6_EDHAE|nr:hypothetical protein EDEG_03366 [Edhazardia aedis USNM 41457]|eukprot:EJW02190.1 hypothetical protein EDEG_03366 [Edhazardia aedis USNM 41457]